MAFMLEEPSTTKYTVGVIRLARTEADAQVFGPSAVGVMFPGMTGATPVAAAPDPKGFWPNVPAVPSGRDENPGRGPPDVLGRESVSEPEQPLRAARTNHTQGDRRSFMACLTFQTS